MTIQFGTTDRTAEAQALVTQLGSGASLLLYSGTVPANCAASATGTLLCTISLPSTPATAASGALALAGTWTGTVATAGTAGYYRLTDSGGTVHEQGTVAETGGDLNLQNTNVAVGQSITITSYAVTEGNA